VQRKACLTFVNDSKLQEVTISAEHRIRIQKDQYIGEITYNE